MSWELVWICGSTAWLSTALVLKNGPFELFVKFRNWQEKLWGYKEDKSLSPFECVFCAGPYVLMPVLLVSYVFPYVIQFFGILGMAAAIRGMSQEY